MNRTALIFMIISETIITGIAVFFFVKVLVTKPKPEPDSYADNDDVPR